MANINFAAPLVEAEFEIEPEPFEAPPPAVIAFPDAASVKDGLKKYDPQVDAIVARANELVVKDAAGRAAALSVISEAKNLFNYIEKVREDLKAPALKYGRVVDKTASYFKDRLAKAEAIAKDKDLVYKRELDRLQAIEEAKQREVARNLQAAIDAEQRTIREEAEAKAREAAEKLKAIQEEENKRQAELEVAAQAQREAAAAVIREAEEKLKAETDEAAKVLLRETIEAEQVALHAPTPQVETDAAARALLERTIQEETEAAHAPAPQVVAPTVQAPPRVIRSEAGSLSYRKKWKCRLIDAAKVEDRFKVVDVRLAQKAVDNGERNLPGFEVFEEESSQARV